MKKIIGIGLLLVIVLSISGCNSNNNANNQQGNNYISANDFKDALENNTNMIILDVQSQEDYNIHHFAGSTHFALSPISNNPSILTNLDSFISQNMNTSQPIVIICGGGRTNATATFNYLVENGISRDRLLVLENGIRNWPFPELLVQ